MSRSFVCINDLDRFYYVCGKYCTSKGKCETSKLVKDVLCVEIRKIVLFRLLLSHESVLRFFISQVYSYDVRTELPVAASNSCLYT